MEQNVIKTITSILGSEYEVTVKSHHEDSRLNGCDGIVDFYGKQIVIETLQNMQECGFQTSNIHSYHKKVVRHEVVHAFLKESGMVAWASDDTLVDWMAVQFPKMLKVFQELGCI